MFEWSGHGQLLDRHTTEHYWTTSMPQCLMCSINQSIRIHHEYPMTVLSKIVNNSMTALLEFLNVLLENIDL